MQVAVVTDSTTYLPDGFADRHGITVVPLFVIVEGQEGLDGVDFGPDELMTALKAKKRVTTSQPSPHQLAKAYRKALANGADAVVAVHLSKELSGTWNSAVLAAEMVCAEHGDDVVQIVDSRTTVMGLGFAAVHAARVAETGATPKEVAEAAADYAERSHTMFVVETLEYLRRGGRIGAATALLGTALAMKPLLHIADGKIKPLEKVRTTGKAMSRLVELAARHAGDAPVELAVQHLAAAECAQQLAQRLMAKIPTANGCVVSELGAVIGAHTGPGVLGVVVQKLPD